MIKPGTDFAVLPAGDLVVGADIFIDHEPEENDADLVAPFGYIGSHRYGGHHPPNNTYQGDPE